MIRPAVGSTSTICSGSMGCGRSPTRPPPTAADRPSGPEGLGGAAAAAAGPAVSAGPASGRRRLGGVTEPGAAGGPKRQGCMSAGGADTAEALVSAQRIDDLAVGLLGERLHRRGADIAKLAQHQGEAGGDRVIRRLKNANQ